MKNLLIDTTFIIPVRLEDNQRLNNLKLILKYLQYYFDTNIIVCESSNESHANLIQSTWNEQCKYMFIQDNKAEFHRTKILNYLTKQTKTPFVINCDTDVLVSVQNYIAAINNLRQNIVDFVFPYSGLFYNIPTEYHSIIENDMMFDNVDLTKCDLIHTDSVGGVVCMNKNKYIESGMENEKFISWGAEDCERVTRWQRLDMRVGRIAGCLYHLNHNKQHQNSGITNPFYNTNEVEYKKVAQMTKDHLITYIKTWGWLK